MRECGSRRSESSPNARRTPFLPVPRYRRNEIRGLLGVEAEMERYKGAHEFVKAYPAIHFVHEAVADWLQSNARERMLEILRAEPAIDVVYAHNDPMAIGAYLRAGLFILDLFDSAHAERFRREVNKTIARLIRSETSCGSKFKIPTLTSQRARR
jgi:hypothetical protein